MKLKKNKEKFWSAPVYARGAGQAKKILIFKGPCIGLSTMSVNTFKTGDTIPYSRAKDIA